MKSGLSREIRRKIHGPRGRIITRRGSAKQEDLRIVRAMESRPYLGEFFGGQLSALVVVTIAPSEQGSVRVFLFQQLFLQSVEGSAAFSIYNGHVHVEEAKQAIGFIFYSGSATLGRP